MRTMRAEQTRTIAAPPDRVYAVIADYRNGHPHILPQEYFSDLTVEAGGYGEGTVIRFRMHLLGTTRVALAKVAEPEPGRVITETYPENGAVTTFAVQPVQDPGRTRLTIRTEWSTPGLRGVIEGWILPRLLRKVFRAEISKLEEHLAGPTPAPLAR